MPHQLNHYYTDNIQKKRQERLTAQLRQHAPADRSQFTFDHRNLIDQAVASWGQAPDANMENFACEEALDCMLAIYKVSNFKIPTPNYHRWLLLHQQDLISYQNRFNKKCSSPM